MVPQLFFSCNELKRLIKGIFNDAEKHENIELSFEGHPNNTTREHLQTLYNLGFTRVSFGVQDYDENVQKAIHRIQSFDQVAYVTETAREIGYKSVSHDIIYGLPFQNTETIINTVNKTAELMPDRISFYSYAHVPWIKGNGQRGFNEEDLPKSEEKRKLYELGRNLLQEKGYHEIGMDHFAKESDDLYKSFKNKKLHRNFMGYTAFKTTVLIGLGASSISDCETAFAQNEKDIKKYVTQLQNNELTVVKGHILSNNDLILRNAILDIICKFKVDLALVYTMIPKDLLLNRLSQFLKDNLLFIENDTLIVTDLGKAFVRNICMAFDEYLIESNPKNQLFSMTI